MKRRILFRGYNLKNKKWLYGYYLVNRGKHYIVKDEVVNPFVEKSDFEVDPESVGQWICNFDDVDCFEGDVVEKTFKNASITFVIKYNDKTTSYDFIKDFNEWVGVWPNENIFKYKVIGNEYEKELKISNP